MFLPKLNFAVVDVRDVAAAHIKAMTTQEASGKELSCTPDKDIWDFTLGLKILSYPCYLTHDVK